MRSSWLLFALLALVALSTAFKVEDALHMDGINAYLHHGVRRQADGTGAASSEPTRSSSPPPESTSVDEPSSTPDSEPSSTPPSAPSSSDSPSGDESTPSTPAPAPSTTPPGATQSTASNTRNVQTTPSPTAKASQTVITKPLVSTEVVQTTTVIEVVTNGSTLRQTSVGTKTFEHTTGTSTETALSNSNNNSGGDSGGLTSEKKAIIGGVIGGVGGAILLGGIAIVCWRMWGKKKRVSEDDADLMAGTGAALGDKSSTASPFHSNLEQYHNPGGRPNAAANF